MKHAHLTEENLDQLVRAFYARVRADDLLGPVFNAAVHDWEEHLPKLQSFWSSVMLGTGRYKGRPLPAHIKHGSAVSPVSFARWLSLWRATAEELFDAGPAAALQHKAEKIGESLAMGIALQRDGFAALRSNSSE